MTLRYKNCCERKINWSLIWIVANDCQIWDSFLMTFIGCHFVCLATRWVVYCSSPHMSSHWETISDALSENGSCPSHSNWKHAVCLPKPCWFGFFFFEENAADVGHVNIILKMAEISSTRSFIWEWMGQRDAWLSVQRHIARKMPDSTSVWSVWMIRREKNFLKKKLSRNQGNIW